MVAIVSLLSMGCQATEPPEVSPVSSSPTAEIGSQPPMTAKPRPSTTTSPTPSPLPGSGANLHEVALLQLLEAAGFPGQVEEHGFQEALVGVEVDGRHVTVRTLPTERAPEGATPVTIDWHSTHNGIEVGYGTTEFDWPAATFDHAGTQYELWTEPSASDALRQLVEAITGELQRSHPD